MYLSIDFGGTRTRVGWFSQTLELLRRDEGHSQTSDPQQVVIERIIALARRVIPVGEKPRAIGVCAPGPQAYTGYILHAPTLPGWDRVPLAQIISEAFDAPVFMENDANLGALAEYHTGAAQGADPAIYLTVSTGIGGGAIINGKLFTGWRGLAIEPGHLKFPDKHGTIHSLEALASGPAIARVARGKLAESAVPSVLRGLTQVDGKAVGEAARSGDPLALEVIEAAGRWLGLGFVAIAHLFNPQAIVVGGSVATLGDLIFNPARAMLTQHLTDPMFNAPDLIRVAALGDDVCLMGAALHAREKADTAD